jgi:RNA polymerase sigma-70 factor (ECF subfamily)
MTRVGPEAYERCVRTSWRALKRLGVPDASVPDAVQDVLLVMHRRRHEFRGEASAHTWLYGIILRVASNYRRRERHLRARGSAADATAVLESVASQAPSPLDEVVRIEAKRLLHALLAAMQTSLREVFVLVELEGLTLPEAAALLAESEATCKSRLRSARRAFNLGVTRARARDEWRLG